MASRGFERASARFQVEFRSPTSLLCAYSVNLSRGGMFVQCEDEMPSIGTALDIDITLPQRGVVSLAGVVAWCRDVPTPDGPRGIGIRFDSRSEVLGVIVDNLVLNHEGIRILVQCADPSDRKTLYRKLRSILGKAHLVFSEDDVQSRGLLSSDTDLVVVDADEGEQPALATLHTAQGEFDLPVLCLAEREENRATMERHGADEVLGNPPNSEALRRSVMKLLSTPRRVSRETS